MFRSLALFVLVSVLGLSSAYYAGEQPGGVDMQQMMLDHCAADFTRAENTFTPGGGCFDKSLDTMDKCVCACKDNFGCVAVDFNTLENPYQGCACWMHIPPTYEASEPAYNENTIQW